MFGSEPNDIVVVFEAGRGVGDATRGIDLPVGILETPLKS
jgi:hypothetical protein